MVFLLRMACAATPRGMNVMWERIFHAPSSDHVPVAGDGLCYAGGVACATQEMPHGIQGERIRRPQGSSGWGNRPYMSRRASLQQKKVTERVTGCHTGSS